MLDFLPTGTNLMLVGPATTLLEGITVERRREYKGIRFSVAASGDRPARADLNEWHLVGYYNKYVATCPSTCLPWKIPYDSLVVKDGPYEGLSLTQVEIAGPERDRSEPFPLDGWIPQGAFHVQYPDKEEGEPCNFFATGEDGPGFMPASDPILLSAEKLVALYCERFGIPNTRDPYSVIIWRIGKYEGLSLRASKRRMDEDLEARQRAALHLAPLTAAYEKAEARAKVAVEFERKALAEERERKAAAAAAAAAAAEANPFDTATAQIKAKEVSLLKELERLEGLQAVHQRVKALESRIATLKSELKIE